MQVISIDYAFSFFPFINNLYVVLDPSLGLMLVNRNFINKYFSGYCLIVPELFFDKKNILVQDILKKEEKIQLLKNRKGF